MKKHILPGERVLAEMKAKKEAHDKKVAAERADTVKQSDAAIVAEKETTTLSKPESYKRTGINLVDDIVPIIHSRCRSSYKQITAIAVSDIAYVASYAGLKGTAHYLFDFSNSGSGKDSSADHSKELLLSPIVSLQMEDAKEYAQERKEDKDLLSKMFKCIHGGDSTVQAVYKGFEVSRSQYVRRGEIGVMLRDKAHPLVNFIIDTYGRKRVEMPSYKKEIDENIPLEVDDASLSFYGNSNLTMLGVDLFRYHMKGGLLNRCLLLYEDYTRPFEELPEEYDLSQIDVISTNERVRSFIDWGKSHAHIEKPLIRKTPEYKKFAKWVYDEEEKLRGSEAQDIHKRTMQNLNSIIYTFHYLSCFEEGVWKDMTTAQIVSNAIKYVKWVISRYDNLIDEVSGVSAEIRSDEKSSKILQYVNDHKLPITLREVYKPMHLKRADVEIAIAGIFKHDGKNITARVGQ